MSYFRAVLALCAALLPGALFAQTGDAGPGAALANPYDYAVRPGDVLSVHVWKEPELTAPVTVRIDGKITIPLVGDVMAWGRSPMQIAARLEEELSRYVEAPEVTVEITSATSARYFVIGQVGSSGQFPLVGRTTLVQALAMAGGFGTFAKRDRIVVIHDTGGPGAFTTVDFKKLEAGETTQNYVIQPGDTIVVP